jgi:hypothetical protein
LPPSYSHPKDYALALCHDHHGMERRRKITVLVHRDLLAKAQKAAEAGISETVRKGLELVAANETYDQLLKMRGQVKFFLDLNELRDDRRFK